jgi:hypothetical protein
MRTIFNIATLLIISVFGYAQDNDSILSSFQDQVAFLSSKDMEGRRAGSKGEEKARSYIIKVLELANILPYNDNYSYPFEFSDISRNKSRHEKNSKDKTANNIAGFIDNGKERTIVIGAHYDHLGSGFHINSLSTEENVIHFGADDNASGVITAIHIANLIRNNQLQEEFNYMIVLFSAEEIGLIGSKKWLAQFNKSLDIAAMINLDMVGRMKDRKVQLYGLGTSKDWLSFKGSLDNTINWEIDSSGMGPSDHASFYLDSIPALHFFTGQHTDYHTGKDTHEKLNYPGMIVLTNTIYDALINLSDSNRFDFIATKNKNTKKRPSLNVTMGIMPSYIQNDSGLKIDGVIDGKPAKKAGLLKDDIIMEIDEKKIQDIYAYMDVLSSYVKGDKAIITVLRNNKTKTLSIQF